MMGWAKSFVRWLIAPTVTDCPACIALRQHNPDGQCGLCWVFGNPLPTPASAERQPDGAAPTADLHPHCSLGEVSFGRRWTIRAPDAAGLPFRIEGDGIAIAIDVAHAAELHVQLGMALIENLRLRMEQAGS